MKVSVRFFAHLGDLIGKKDWFEVEVPDDVSILQLIDVLVLDTNVKNQLLDTDSKLKSDITILKNGREIRFLEEMNTKLESDDKISFFPLVAGG